mgnify:CR=1 FL=1
MLENDIWMHDVMTMKLMLDDHTLWELNEKMNENEYEIVAGERRWRASQMAQLHELPVIVKDFSDSEVLEVAIIENIQRADLNPIEEATGYHQLIPLTPDQEFCDPF